MRDRRRAVLLLLGSRDDGFWFPAGSLRTDAGLAPGLIEPCRGCGGLELKGDTGGVLARRRGSGRVRDRYGRERVCGGCGGAGVVASDRMDASGARLGSSLTGAPPSARTVPCDACAGGGVVRGARCERCGGEGRRLAHLFELRLDTRLEGERDPVDAALDARAASGSYRELDRALEQLREGDRSGWRRLLAAVDAGETAPLAPELEPPLHFLCERMPETVSVPGEVVRNGFEQNAWRKRVRGPGAAPAALGARDQEIRRLLRRGSPVQWVAHEYGLSVAQVYRVRAG